MQASTSIFKRIKESVSLTDPSAIVILYGSYARGKEKKDSDIDVLILVDKDNVSRTDEKRLKYPLYDIEFETGHIISPLVLSKFQWETKHRNTPFYENISKEGILL